MDLYQELILEHSKRPQHAGLREPFEGEAHHVNTTCGDEVTVRAHVDGDTLADVSYDSLGCSISVASASMMADELIGRPIEEVRAAREAVSAMLTSKGTDPGDEDEIGDAVALAGVSRYPARVKCALLPWAALTDAMARAGTDITSPQIEHGRTA